MNIAHVERKQAFRYMCLPSEPDAHFLEMADKCEKMLLSAVKPNYVYRVFPIESTEQGISGGGLLLKGNDIKEHLKECSQVVFLCATLSAGADRAIRQSSAFDILSGMMTDAMANALIEQVCDKAEQEIFATFPDNYFTWRFSAGYGDFPLDTQADFLKVLNAEKRLGVTLSENDLLIPTKTVTAVIGVSETPIPKGKKGCAICNLSEKCPYRAKGVHCHD
ncbi:MAG TPA: hypothetical protein DCO72_10345 [Ruminococcus sp.]|nr:hypothetical protein [Ruminococcus sp.]